MITLTDSVLAQAGISFADAVALLQPSEGELVVHVVELLDGPPVPASGPVDADTAPSPSAISFPGIAPGAPHGGDALRLTHRASDGDDDTVPTILPTDVDAMPSAAMRPARLADFAPVHDALGRELVAPPVHDLLGLGKVSDTYDDVFRDARRLAAGAGHDLRQENHGCVTLEGASGPTTHPSLRAALAALLQRV